MGTLNYEHFSGLAMDSLSSEVIVTLQDGTIAFVNKSWKEFGLQNNASKQVIKGTNLNYLNVCTNARGPGANYGHRCAEGLRSVLYENETLFEMEYPCHHPNGRKRWFMLRIAPIKIGNKCGSVITHINISKFKPSFVETTFRPTHLKNKLSEKNLEFKSTKKQLTKALIELEKSGDSLFNTDDINLANLCNTLFQVNFDLQTVHNKSYRTIKISDQQREEIVESLNNISLKTKSLILHMMLDFGIRDAIIPSIISTLKYATDGLFYDAAMDLAFLLSEHYSIYDHDDYLANKYFSLYQEYSRHDNITKKTLYSAGVFFNQSGKNAFSKSAITIRPILSKIENSFSHKSFNKYWFIIYMFQIKEAEAKGDLCLMIRLSKEALRKTTVKQTEKSYLISFSLIRALIGKGRYKEALSYIAETKDLEKRPSYNASKCMLGKAQAALNLNDVELASNYLQHVRGSETNDLDKWKDLFHQYGHLITAQWDRINLTTTDEKSEKFVAATIVAKLWHEIGSQQEISSATLLELEHVKHQINEDSRTWAFIQLLLSKSSSSHNAIHLQNGFSQTLLSKMKSLPSDALRGEVINYEIVWETLSL